MTDKLLEQIKADRESGTPGPWAAFYDEVTGVKATDGRVAVATQITLLKRRHPTEAPANARRIARVPDMESRILADTEVIAAARELEAATRFYKDFVLDHTGNSEVVPVFTNALARVDRALTAFRKAMKKREDG